MKVITPGKIVPYKSCLPCSNTSVKVDFDTLFLTNVTHFQVLQHLLNMDKMLTITISHTYSYFGKKMCGVYVTYVADVDTGVVL